MLSFSHIFKAAIAAFVLLASHANAGAIYEVSGDLVPSPGSSASGSFSITIDTDDLNMTLVSAHPNLPISLYEGPWYGYDIMTADVTFGAGLWSESDVKPEYNEPAVSYGFLNAEMWLTGGEVDGSFSSLGIILENSYGLLSIGFHTTTFANGYEQNRIINEVLLIDGNGTTQRGSYENLSVKAVQVSEPGSLALLALGLFGLGYARRA